MSARIKTPLVQPYLFFGGRCEEAIEFYKKALGAEVKAMMRFDESPDPLPEPVVKNGFERKIMHAAIAIGDHTVMLSDEYGEEGGFQGFSLAVTLEGKEEVSRAFDLLSEGGEGMMPPGETFWSPWFGMARDKFGMGWMLMVPDPES